MIGYLMTCLLCRLSMWLWLIRIYVYVYVYVWYMVCAASMSMGDLLSRSNSFDSLRKAQESPTNTWRHKLRTPGSLISFKSLHEMATSDLHIIPCKRVDAVPDVNSRVAWFVCVNDRDFVSLHSSSNNAVTNQVPAFSLIHTFSYPTLLSYSHLGQFSTSVSHLDLI